MPADSRVYTHTHIHTYIHTCEQMEVEGNMTAPKTRPHMGEATLTPRILQPSPEWPSPDERPSPDEGPSSDERPSPERQDRSEHSIEAHSSVRKHGMRMYYLP